MSYVDFVSENIIQKINWVMDQGDMSSFIYGMKSITTQVYLINSQAALRMEKIIDKGLILYKKQKKKIPGGELMVDAIDKKKQQQFYLTECENNCRDYIINNVRKIIKEEYILS